MAFFREVVSIDVRLSPDEVERRLRRVVRQPRTVLEVLQRKPVNPPDSPAFVGQVGNGRLALSRLADDPGSTGRFQFQRPEFRGAITPTASGSALRVEFFDRGLFWLAGGLSLSMSAVVLVVTRGWPPWRPEHALIVGVVGISLWAYRYSLMENVKASTALLQSCLARG